MDNTNHIEILKEGVTKWNLWRSTLSEEITPLLENINLRDYDLKKVNFHKVILSGADLSGADLSGADLSFANLSNTNFTKTKLIETNFLCANLERMDMSNAALGKTIFADVKLDSVFGLETCLHVASSALDFQSLIKSEGKIPIKFLKGCGLTDQLIEYIHLFSKKSGISYYSIFISYSSADEAFAQRIYNDLQTNGIRCWFAPQDMKAGSRIRDAIYDSIKISDKVLLILSNNSIRSQWVEEEVNVALERERKKKETILFPIRIDNTIMESSQRWVVALRRTRHIGDFRNWRNDEEYRKAISRLTRDLISES